MNNTEPKSVREIVKVIQNATLKADELSPDQAAEMLVTLSSIYGNCNDEIRKADHEYKQILLLALDSEKSANKARIRAETDPSFQRWQEAKHTKDLVEELIRSLKYFLRNKEQEYQV